MHMKNPHIPAMHFNTRYIYTTFGWFGGGIDMTPSIKDSKEEKWFHKELQKTCNRHSRRSLNFDEYARNVDSSSI